MLLEKMLEVTALFTSRNVFLMDSATAVLLKNTAVVLVFSLKQKAQSLPKLLHGDLKDET